MVPELTSEELLQQLTNALRNRASAPVAVDAETLEWLALVPVWPAEVAERGFPGPAGLITGTGVKDMLQPLVDSGDLDCVNAVPPWSGKLYRMSRNQRRRALQLAQTRPRRSAGTPLDEATRACRQLLAVRTDFQAPYPLVLRHWCALLEPRDRSHSLEPAEVADRLFEGVQDALRKARGLGLDGSPETASLLEAAEPLVSAIGGPLRVASARCQRELELHHRQSRDARLLSNYQNRRELDRSFEELLAKDEHWALHYVGVGGVGKTMFLRHLQSSLASEFRLATARVDFDHLNPDYPLRSPGLLLLNFAEELKLEAPEGAIDYFRKLGIEVSQLHAQLESARRDGRDVALGFSAPGFDFCLQIFVEALGAFERSGRRPVLILDTCEELARLRFDGQLPRTVSETFLILEEMHRRLPQLRVVFSGRRALAREGAGWHWGGEELPRREYLLLCPILGFDRDEAAELLQSYRRKDNDQEAAVPPDLYEGILEISKSAGRNDLSRLSHPSIPLLSSGRMNTVTIDRYNPFDIDLYANWAAADATLTAEKLHEAGRHHYVRERIVARLREDIRTWLPHLTLLGRYDEELVQELAGSDAPNSLWSEIRQQEWTDMDRGSAGGPDQAAFSFWNIDPQMRIKLESFYEEEQAGTWAGACRQVVDVLERITIDRDWSLLTPSYFEVCAGLLRDDPARAARWWRRVEEKILSTDAWDWADRITAALLAPGGGLDTMVSADEDCHPLDAPIRALQANVLVHGSQEVESLESIWLAVSRSAKEYPDPNGRMVLEFRAQAGIVANLRYRSETLVEHYAFEFQGILERIPSLDTMFGALASPETAALQRQAIHTEMALLDNAVEVMEQVEWSSPPAPALVSIIEQRAARLGDRLGAQEWLGLYIQRLRLLSGVVDANWSWMDNWQSPCPEVLNDAAFDWFPPKDMESRRLLECGRILESGKVIRFVRGFAEKTIQRVALPSNLDEDRLLSQAMRFLSEIAKETATQMVPVSIRLASQREECQAHKRVQPLFVTAIQLMAHGGDIDATLDVLQRARSGQPAELIVRWLNRVAAHLNRNYLLAEPGPEDVPIRDLPFGAENPNAASTFVTATAANIIRVSEDRLSAEDLAREKALAQAICEKQGFTLPVTTQDLPAVSPGWRPWFARYLIVTADRGEWDSLKDTLKGLYGTQLPGDVAFLEPKAAVPAAAPAAASAKRTSWFASILSGIVTLVVLLAFFRVAVDWVDRGATYLTGHKVPWWEPWLILGALLLAPGFLAILVPALLRQYARAISGLMDVESSLKDFPDETYSVQTTMKIWAWIKLLVPSLKTQYETIGKIDEKLPYAEMSKGFDKSWAHDSGGTSLSSRTLRWFIGQARINHRIAVTAGSVARTPWEAILGMSTGRSTEFSGCPFIFRRVGEKAWNIDDPFAGKMVLLSVSAIRDLSAWKALAPDTEKTRASHTNRLPDEPDRRVGVLMIQAEVSTTEAGIRFALQAGSHTTFGAEDVARLFPNLRLLVLMGLDRGEASPRTLLDRVIAGQSRSVAHEAFRVAAPLVIGIPSLPARTNLVDEALKAIVAVAVQEHGNVVPPMQRAIRGVQDRIFAASGLGPADATELAYDVCYYAPDSLNLKVDTKADEFQRMRRNSQA